LVLEWRILYVSTFIEAQKDVALKHDEKDQRPIAMQHRTDAQSQAPGDEVGRLVCPNCGGDVSADDARCPYCGALNPSGAEKAYMDTLEDLKDDTDRIAEDVEDDIEEDLKSNTRWIAILVAVVIALIAVAFVAVQCSESSDEKRELQSYQARESFREQYFQEFDRLYEAGDDDALSAYVWSLMDEPGFDALYSWEHANYLQMHDDWEALNVFKAQIDAESPSIDDYAWATSVAIRLARLDADGKRNAGMLSQEEKERAEEYHAYAWRFLEDMLQMSPEEVEAFAASVEDARGNIEIDKVKEGLKQRFGQLEPTS
jgi:hypothetical protein